MTCIYLPVAGLFIAILMNILYFSKANVNNRETRIYNCLLLLNLFHCLLDCFIITLVKKLNIIIPVLNKFDMILIMLWLSFIFIYIVTISFNIKKYKRFILIITIINILASILIIILPFTLINEGEILDTAGMATTWATIICLLYILSSAFIVVYSIISKSSKINSSKYFPLYILIAFMTICLLIRKVMPSLIFEPFMISFINLIMFFTIENPDLNHIKELNFAKDQAEKANKAKTDFLSSMSHEIRTPLNAIVGFSECLIDSKDLNETKSFAQDIVDASHNLLEIVNGILDISKIEANKMEVIPKEYNPREVFNSLSKLVTPRISEKPIEFKTYLSPDLPGILKGDMAKVKQVVLNLLTNAAKYTTNGEIVFNVNCVNRNDTNTCLLYVSVKDTGRGIKKEDMEKLFQKFERLDEDKNTTVEGTGLGLAITKSLTEMMGGRINVFSKYGEGSTFRVYLEQEIISMDIPDDNSEEIEINYNTHQGKRILVVDDSKINLKVANQILKPYNFNIITAESGFEALELAETQTFDLVLMDIMMPKMNGVETLRRLKEMEGFDVPVIALTADAIEGQDEKYIQSGFNDYLSKPIDRYLLDKVLNKYLGGKNNE